MIVYILNASSHTAARYVSEISRLGAKWHLTVGLGRHYRLCILITLEAIGTNLRSVEAISGVIRPPGGDVASVRYQAKAKVSKLRHVVAFEIVRRVKAKEYWEEMSVSKT